MPVFHDSPRLSTNNQPLLDAIQAEQRVGAYIDVGASEGHDAVFFANECPSTQVYAFEPNARRATQAFKNVWLNVSHHRSVKVIAEGVHGRWSGMHTEDLKFEAHEVDIDTAPCIRLDNVRADLGDVAVLKISCGQTPSIIESAEQLIDEQRPLIVVSGDARVVLRLLPFYALIGTYGPDSLLAG